MGVAGKQKYKELLLKIYKGLSNIKVLRYAGITSRSGEDPEWDFDAGEIEDVIIIGSGPSDNEKEEDDDGPPNQQIDPEDPNKVPLENTDDEGDIGNEGNENNNKGENSNNQNNDNINEHLDKLQKILSNAKLNQYISGNRNLTFRKSDKCETFWTLIKRDPQTGQIIRILGFEYNEAFFLSLSEDGILVVLLHEYIHAYRAINGLDFSHDAMIDDPMYLEGIKNIFPGHSDAFYDVMIYVGCPDAQGFLDLSPSNQYMVTEIIEEYIKNKKY